MRAPEALLDFIAVDSGLDLAEFKPSPITKDGCEKAF